jgi:hypothetical protein
MDEMAQIERTAFSRKERRLFGFDLHSWEQVMLVSLGFAALAAVFVVVATTAVVKLQKKEADDADKALNAYKLTVEDKVADAKTEGIKAGATAGNAMLRAAELEKESAALKLGLADANARARSKRSLRSKSSSSLGQSQI